MLGANLVVSSPLTVPDKPQSLEATPASQAAPTLIDADIVMGEVAHALTPDVTAAAPFLYVVARAGRTPVVVAGTWLDQAHKLEPAWRLDGGLDHVAYR